jgi:hypothetical protein
MRLCLFVGSLYFHLFNDNHGRQRRQDSRPTGQRRQPEVIDGRADTAVQFSDRFSANTQKRGDSFGTRYVNSGISFTESVSNTNVVIDA